MSRENNARPLLDNESKAESFGIALVVRNNGARVDHVVLAAEIKSTITGCAVARKRENDSISSLFKRNGLAVFIESKGIDNITALVGRNGEKTLGGLYVVAVVGNADAEPGPGGGGERGHADHNAEDHGGHVVHKRFVGHLPVHGNEEIR